MRQKKWVGDKEFSKLHTVHYQQQQTKNLDDVIMNGEKKLTGLRTARNPRVEAIIMVMKMSESPRNQKKIMPDDDKINGRRGESEAITNNSV
jgi:hypothetical protein